MYVVCAANLKSLLTKKVIQILSQYSLSDFHIRCLEIIIFMVKSATLDSAFLTEITVPVPSFTFDPLTVPRPLNSSQVVAIEHMLSEHNQSRISIIQGPPGTGKTTVIASFVLTAIQHSQRGIWLIAQSNVAVKNIAEKLADFGLFNWKLLVSKDFYEYWQVINTQDYWLY